MKMAADTGDVLPETKEYLGLPEDRRGKEVLFPHRFQREEELPIP